MGFMDARICLGLVLLLQSALLTTVSACGGFFCEPQRPVIQSGEAIVFGVNDRTNQVTMHVQILYEGPAEAFSWVLPLPVTPDDISVGSDLLFSALFQQTVPQWQLQILNETFSSTCTGDALEGVQCAFRENFAEDEEAAEGGGAVVLDQGSVGPFDFVVLEAAENDPSSVLEWLNDNGYDQPEGSGPLLNYYAVNNHVFVALRLQKQAETGEIQPLIISYTIPGDASQAMATTTTQVARRAMACVPIQLTRIAATESMPIQVYILGQARAVPLNFVEIELDETQADWVACQNNPGCHYDDYMDRFDRAASQLVNHSFVTEYAGSSALMANTVEIQDVTEEQLAQATSFDDFRWNYRFLLPDLPLVDALVQDFATQGDEAFNATGLAAELEAKVLKPARDAQAFVDGHPYLTRLYARLSPDYMTKDPFFAFKPELPDVDRIHRATGIPVCTGTTDDGLEPSGLIIQVEGYPMSSAIQVPAIIDCSGWVPGTGPIVSINSNNTSVTILSPALQVSSWGFAGDEGVIVMRKLDGTFDEQGIQEAIGFGDSLVMNQTIPEYTATNNTQSTATDNTQSTAAPSSGNTDSPGRAATAAFGLFSMLMLNLLA